MKDERKQKAKPQLISTQLNQCNSTVPRDLADLAAQHYQCQPPVVQASQSEVLAEQNLSQMIEPSKTLLVGIKAEVEDEIVFEESSQRYADRKISQQFNCDLVVANEVM